MKICLACSHGGHLTEMLQLTSAFEGYEYFFITYEGARTNDLQYKYTIKNIGKNPLRLLLSIPYLFKILIKEKPDLVISTGSEIAIPVFYIARSLGIKTMFIESLCRVREPSITGEMVYPISNLFLVQWKQLLKKYGDKAQYWGSTL
jgi:UDP-N-acetylglucosamine:LPS N-acetylglucosamine transferase